MLHALDLDDGLQRAAVRAPGFAWTLPWCWHQQGASENPALARLAKVLKVLP
jgi:hypothetical protein